MSELANIKPQLFLKAPQVDVSISIESSFIYPFQGFTIASRNRDAKHDGFDFLIKNVQNA